MAEAARPIRASVLIVGAGPVGMTMALDLAQSGVDVAIVERRAADAEPRQRCNHISARTMEIFRQVGVAGEIRDAGLPHDFPQDVTYVTSMVGYELCRIPIAARNDTFDSVGYADSGWPTPEPPHRCNQMYFEPILQRHIVEDDRIQQYYETEIVAVSQDGDGVRAKGIAADGTELTFEADYLVGCDGGPSLVRKAIGAKFEGADALSRTRSTFVRAPDLLKMLPHKPAWMTWFLNPDGWGNIVAMNGDDLWAFHLWMPPHLADFDDLEPEKAIRSAIGADTEVEILNIDDWVGRRFVANKFRDRRIFICGDAAHLWVPFAGYGMNAGIADAWTLSWQLAGAVKGWGGPRLLDGYDIERRPVTDQVSRHVMSIALSHFDVNFITNPPAELYLEGPEGDAMRAQAGRFFYDVNVGQFASSGLNFATYFEGSPIIAYDGVAAPAYDLTTYQPSTVPGCRTPHLWLPDGRSLYDAMGRDFALLRSDPTIDCAPLIEAADERGLPLRLVDIPAGGEDNPYDFKLVLSRPDQHVAWRGNAVPDDPAAVIALVSGAAQ
ncbi:FAD-dependent oxidoreductase [Sphingomonas sp.]|uniref:FAD-dependent oxidoreductase n=1 Tax=Sphingomonas sp. TaxID=28214 RepID=UPI002FCA6343